MGTVVNTLVDEGLCGISHCFYSQGNRKQVISRELGGTKHVGDQR